MNLQHQRIQDTCEALKLRAIDTKWGAIADKAAMGKWEKSPDADGFDDDIPF